MTTPLEAADRVSSPILVYGRDWMLDPATGERADELGLDGLFGFWVNGRAGVVGDVDSEVAGEAIGVCSPSFVQRYWEHRPDGLSSMDCSEAYAAVAAEWGRVKLAAVATKNLERLDELASRVASAADASMGTLFAGWRSIEHPDDPAGRVTVRLNVLREMRGGAHLLAVAAVGLTPLDAVMSTDDPVRGGEAGASRFGWTAPFPAPKLEARVEAEALTSVYASAPFEALASAERSELVELVDEVASA